MTELILSIITAIALIIIAICQLKQAFNPVIYPDYMLEETGVEVPQDTEMDEDNPVFKMIMDAYEKSNTFTRPTEFVQQIIDDDTGVEVITEQYEKELYNGR